MNRFATKRLLALVSALFSASGCTDALTPTAVALATGERGVTAIAVDSGFVYWSKNDGSIKRIAVDGGPAATLVSGQNAPKNITVNGPHVFWTTDDNLIRVASKEGDVPITLVTEPRNLIHLAVDASRIYWTAEDRALKRALRVEESPPEPLATDLPGPSTLALNGNDVFWANAGDTTHQSSIMRVSIDGGSPATLIEDQLLDNLTADAEHLYWSTSGDEGRVSWAALDGSDVRTVAIDRVAQVTAVKGDEASAFWTASDGTLSKADIDGEQYPVELVKGPPGLVSLALDSTSIYWANANDTAIMMMPKP